MSLTPGPWRCAIDPHNGQFVIATADGELIADVEPLLSSEANAANAALMTASPVLLDAVIELVNASMFDRSAVPAAVQKGRNAIRLVLDSGGTP